MNGTNDSDTDELRRYRRQMNFRHIGVEGQRRLSAASVAVIGTGALGTTIAERLVRAGVGRLRLIDRDWVELDNLPRQTLFVEQDALERRPKAIAAREQLQKIDSKVDIDASVTEFAPENALELLTGIDVILDGTDNFETRYLINDCSLELNIPWIHGGVIGSSGQVMSIVPGKTCCLRCIFPDLPNPEELETCNTAGVLGPSVSIVAAWQALEAIKLIVAGTDSLRSEWISIETWDASVRRFSADFTKLSFSCPACGLGHRDFLSGQHTRSAVVLCGRNAVQIGGNNHKRVDLEKIAHRLQNESIDANPFFVRLRIAEGEMTIFADGRTIVTGTEDPIVARMLIDRWIGG